MTVTRAIQHHHQSTRVHLLISFGDKLKVVRIAFYGEQNTNKTLPTTCAVTCIDDNHEEKKSIFPAYNHRLGSFITRIFQIFGFGHSITFAVPSLTVSHRLRGQAPRSVVRIYRVFLNKKFRYKGRLSCPSTLP